MTGFVEFHGGHFIAYVRQKSGWMKCDDSVVSRLAAGVTGKWPSLIFLEKLRRQARVEPAVSALAPGAWLARLPGLLAAAVTGESSDWQRRVARRTELPARDGEGLKTHRHWTVSKLALKGSSRRQNRAGRQQERTGRSRKENRTGRKQKQNRADRKREPNCAERKREENRTDRTQAFVGPREG